MNTTDQESLGGLYISAAHKSSGKTILTTGLCAALRTRGIPVQPFKKGPDYIDPLWLTRAAGVSCLNLDFHTQTPVQLKHSFENTGGFPIIEGNKGLHDGVSVNGSDSNAELASLLDVPVLLVLDTQGTTRGIAPLILGYQQFDPRIKFAGVVLNKVAGSRHEYKLRSNVEAHTDLPVLGAIPRSPELTIDERHIGLTPSTEVVDADEKVETIRREIESGIDIDRLTGSLNARSCQRPLIKPYPNPDIRIGIPRDRAFGFYYVDDLEAFRREGAELSYFDTLNDSEIPDNVDGLFIGGGFPEVHMEALCGNTSMRQSIRQFAALGGPIYAECGGLMYLGESIEWNGETASMCGVLPVKVEMQNTPVGRGYVELEETELAPWGPIRGNGHVIRAHEFHFSKIQLNNSDLDFIYKVKRGWGISGSEDGLLVGNVLASYSHLRNIEPVNWVQRFTGYVRSCRENNLKKTQFA